MPCMRMCGLHEPSKTINMHMRAAVGEHVCRVRERASEHAKEKEYGYVFVCVCIHRRSIARCFARRARSPPLWNDHVYLVLRRRRSRVHFGMHIRVV